MACLYSSATRRSRAAVLLTLLTVSTAACQPIDEPPNPLTKCRASLVSPYKPRVTTGLFIRGDAHLSCKSPIDSHLATLYLERLSPDGWVVKDHDTSREIPTAKGFDLVVLLGCSLGTWRLRLEVKAASGSHSASPKVNSETLRLRTSADCRKAT